MSTSKFRVLRTCEFCGKEFYAQKVSTRYCSKRCNELAYKQRRRQRQITEAEARVLQKPIEEVGNKEFLSLQDASVLFGITKRSVYNLIYNGVLQAFKFIKLGLKKRSDKYTPNSRLSWNNETIIRNKYKFFSKCLLY